MAYYSARFFINRNEIVARPKIEIDEKEVEKLASYGCKNTEIADFFNCDPDTITRRFANILAKARAGLKQRIRKAQIDFALKGNATLLIWLGKNELGQKDNETVSENTNTVVRVEFVKPDAD
jgi:hypothetical protein